MPVFFGTKLLNGKFHLSFSRFSTENIQKSTYCFLIGLVSYSFTMCTKWIGVDYMVFGFNTKKILFKLKPTENSFINHLYPSNIQWKFTISKRILAKETYQENILTSCIIKHWLRDTYHVLVLFTIHYHIQLFFPPNSYLTKCFLISIAASVFK